MIQPMSPCSASSEKTTPPVEGGGAAWTLSPKVTLWLTELPSPVNVSV